MSAGPVGSQTSTPTPVVTGSTRVGRTLAAAAGTWDAGVALGYQWLRDGAPIAGATSTTYAVLAGDLARRMSVVVTGTRPGFATVSRTSAQTAPVVKGRLDRPPKPKIKGSAKVGQRLKVVPGAWPSGVRLKFRWYVDGRAVRGATGKRLLLKQSFRGKRIQVKVTGKKPGYRPRKTTSARTGAVV